ncbi:MAG: UPF0058 family protein [Halobacteriaceae archaeon]
MKKQELIHLHGLLAEVGEYCDAPRGDSFDRYEEMGVRPTSIHKSKTDHKDAVFALAESITDGLDTETTTEQVAASAD